MLAPIPANRLGQIESVQLAALQSLSALEIALSAHPDVILLDVDHFKAFNDTYGHVSGADNTYGHVSGADTYGHVSGADTYGHVSGALCLHQVAKAVG